MSYVVTSRAEFATSEEAEQFRSTLATAGADAAVQEHKPSIPDEPPAEPEEV